MFEHPHPKQGAAVVHGHRQLKRAAVAPADAAQDHEIVRAIEHIARCRGIDIHAGEFTQDARLRRLAVGARLLLGRGGEPRQKPAGAGAEQQQNGARCGERASGQLR